LQPGHQILFQAADSSLSISQEPANAQDWSEFHSHSLSPSSAGLAGRSGNKSNNSKKVNKLDSESADELIVFESQEFAVGSFLTPTGEASISLPLPAIPDNRPFTPLPATTSLGVGSYGSAAGSGLSGEFRSSSSSVGDVSSLQWWLSGNSSSRKSPTAWTDLSRQVVSSSSYSYISFSVQSKWRKVMMMLTITTFTLLCALIVAKLST